MGHSRGLPPWVEERLAAVGDRLTARDLTILRTLEQHVVLTTEQLTRLLFSSPVSAQHRLAVLHHYDLVDRFHERKDTGGHTSFRYVLGEAGAAVLALRRHGETDQGSDPRRPETPVRLDPRYRQPHHKIRVEHSQRLAHTLGVNELATALAGHARRTPGAALERWSSERRCRLWCGETARPDARLVWTENGRSVDVLLEYDRGTENHHRLLDKIPGYRALQRDRGIASWVVFAFPSAGREAELRRAFADIDDVPIATAVPGCPADAIWLPLRATRRLRLAELADVDIPLPARLRAASDSARSWRYANHDDEEVHIERT
ncbi:MAG TPA: replication-relaxation family protein [Mycobacteriales bacterium]|jgi:hypothetical protein|nr:replication-relaxation family protein [Mycobacteriales bacterium]